MRSTYFLGAAAALTLIATDPAICAQAAPPPPTDTMQAMPTDPANPAPAPMPDPSQPTPPIAEPMPPEMPMPAGEVPPASVRGSTDAPIGPMATPPASAAQDAQSGGTTAALMQPVAATKEYPLCSKTVQDSCRNPGEGPKRAKKPR